MELHFLGTGAAEGAPAMYCDCETCRELRRRGEKEWHTRSQLVIDGAVGIDFPPDAYYHALRFNVDLAQLKYLLITHSHMDHFYAHDFILRGYKYASTLKTGLEIYGNAEVCAVYKECTRRELREEIAATIKMTEVYPFTPFSFGDRKEYEATPLLAQHSKTETAFVYLIEKENKTYLHLTDTGRLPTETLDFLQKYLTEKGKTLDFITFDCTFLFYTAGEISRHMGLGDNKAMQEEFLRRKIAGKHTMYAITHYSHNSSPLSETLKRAEEQFGYLPAFDGMTVEF